MYVCAGTICVTADDMIFVVPSGNAILIPPRTMHEVRMPSGAQLLASYIALPPDAPCNTGCRNIPVSKLLLELMQAAVALPLAYEQGGREGRIMDLIAEEVAWLVAQPRMLTLQLPVPKDARLLRLCREFLRELDRSWTIDEAAREAGMGRRTFTRAFRREVGISFSSWRLRARLNTAINRLSAGASVTEVAFESGYGNPSAFATMFKRFLGVPPSYYQASGARDVDGSVEAEPTGEAGPVHARGNGMRAGKGSRE